MDGVGDEAVMDENDKCHSRQSVKKNISCNKKRLCNKNAIQQPT